MQRKKVRARSEVASGAIGGGKDRGAGGCETVRQTCTASTVPRLVAFRHDDISGGALLAKSARQGAGVATTLKLAHRRSSGN
jgi:hypothetical protein